MSLRRPSCSTRIESFSERLIMCKMPNSEKCAPLFVATEYTTSRFPRVTSTSVTSSLMDFRLEIARRCCWLLDLALATKARASSRSDCRRTGPATSIESSKANLLMILIGALSTRASRLASWTRAATSISCSSRPITSPNIQISSSVYRPAISKSVAYHNARWQLSAEPRETAISNSCRNDIASIARQKSDRRAGGGMHRFHLSASGRRRRHIARPRQLKRHPETPPGGPNHPATLPGAAKQQLKPVGQPGLSRYLQACTARRIINDPAIDKGSSWVHNNFGYRRHLP